jgi:hypothetical protein
VEVGMKLLRIVVNSFAFVIIIILAYIFWQSNPLFSIVLFLSAIDQLEDVYYYSYGKRFFPKWFMPLDIIFEFTLFGIALMMFIFSIIYYAYFETWFFRALIPLSLIIMYSSIEDVVLWEKTPIQIQAKPLMGMVYVCKKEEICKGERFVKRK